MGRLPSTSVEPLSSTQQIPRRAPGRHWWYVAEISRQMCAPTCCTSSSSSMQHQPAMRWSQRCCVHSMRLLRELQSEIENCGFLLIDTCNAFNEGNRACMILMVGHEWPSGTCTFNCYRHHLSLFLHNKNSTAYTLHSNARRSPLHVFVRDPPPPTHPGSQKEASLCKTAAASQLPRPTKDGLELKRPHQG